MVSKVADLNLINETFFFFQAHDGRAGTSVQSGEGDDDDDVDVEDVLTDVEGEEGHVEDGDADDDGEEGEGQGQGAPEVNFRKGFLVFTFLNLI